MASLTVSNYLAMLQDDSDSDEALTGLRQALTSGDPGLMGPEPVRLVEAARVAHERRGELRAAAELIELQTALVHDDPDLEAALWKELGRLRHEELLDDEGARGAYQRALELRPGDVEIQQAIERIDLSMKKWRQIADRFVQEAEDASDPTLKTSLLTRAAALVWQHKKKGRESEADKLFRKALEADPSDARTCRLYGVTLRSRERWEDAAEILVGAARALRNRDEKLNFFTHAGRIFVRRLQDATKAAQCYQAVLEYAPGHEEALRYLVDYYTEREDWDRLVKLYEDALRSRQKVESEQGILLQLGMVHWRIRKAPGEAEPYFARLRKIDPAHPGMLAFYREYKGEQEGDQIQSILSILSDAHRVAKDPSQKLSLAVELARAAQKDESTLERAVDAWKTVQRLDPHNAEAHAALKQLYRKTEKWNALVELLRAEVDALPPDRAEERITLLRELVPIYRDRLQLDVMVINTWNAVLQEVPGDEEALAALAKTYESMGRWNDLIQILGRRAEATTDPAEQVGYFMRVASLWIERFANYNQAVKPLERIIEIDPEHREALSRLKEIYTKKRAWMHLYDVLKKESELASDPTVRIELKVELAKLAGERLHKHADAIALWREVIDTAPETPGAIDALERLAEREKDWSTLAHVLELRVAQAADDKEKLKHLPKLGTVYAEHLNDHARAATAWQRILEVDPKNGRALRTLREAYLSAEDWEGLERLYADAGDWEGLVEVLGTAAERTESPDLKVNLSFRAAELYESQLSSPQRAFRSYERVLGVDPKNVRAARALLPIYENDEKWARVVALLEVLLGALPDDSEDPTDRLELLSRLRSLCLHKLSDEQNAFLWAAEAYQIAPSDPGVIEGLEEAARAARAHEELVDLYKVRLEKASGEEAGRLRRRVAAMAGEQLGRSDEAITQLEAILEREPGDEEALAVLDRLYRAGGRHDALRKLYLHRLEHTAEDAAARRSLLVELAKLEEDVLGDAGSAAARYRDVLEIDGGDQPALLALDRLATGGSRFEEVAEVLRRRLDLVKDDAERVELTLRLGDLYREKLGDPRAALDAYADVLRVRSIEKRAVAGLEQLEEGSPELALDAGRLLEGAYRGSGDYQALARVLRKRMAATKDDQERRALSLRLAELAGSELGDVEGAYQALEAAFLERPDDAELWDRLGAAAERAGKHEALAQAFATAIEAGDLGPSDASQLAARVAEIYDVVLGRPEAAEQYHQRVIKHDPLHEKSFLRLKELYTNEERWDVLQVLYRNRIAETVDGEAKLELLLQVCFLFEEILDDPELAIRAYQEVIELSPDHHSSRRALERLYRRTSRWRDLVALRRQELDKADGQEAIELMVELGDLHERKLDEAGAAVDYYESVLERAPTHLRAQEALERLIETKSQRQRIAAILEPLYDKQGAWPELARVLEVQLEDVSDPGSRVALLTRIAEIHEDRQHDTEQAFAALSRAVESDPSDGRVRQELARIADARGTGAQRARVLEKAIEATKNEPYLQGELLLEVAKLHDEQRDVDAAERAYTRLIGVDSDNPSVVLPASQALERIHLEKGDYPALAQDLRRQVQFEQDQVTKAQLLVRLADLLETTLDDVEGAIGAHRERLDIEPTNIDALRALETLYERQQQWEKLIGVLQSREAATVDESEQRGIARRIGRIYEERLSDQENAVGAYNDVISRFGADRETLSALIRLYEGAGQWEDLLEALQMDHDLAAEVDEKARLRFRAAELMRGKTGDLDRAIEAYAEVLSEIPGHEGTIAALSQLLGSDADLGPRIAAARVLVPHYESTQSYEELIGALEVIAEADEPYDRLRALRRAAEVADVGLGSPTRAFDALSRAIRAGLGEHDLRVMLDELERLAAAADRWPDFVGLLKEVAPDILDGDLQTDVLLKIAAVARTRLDDHELARKYYARVRENHPDHAGALDALEQLHDEAKDHGALLEVLRAKTELAATKDRIALLLRQAEICETRLNDVPAAIDAYEQVLAEEERAEAYEGLERLYTKAERWIDLGTLYERQLEKRVGDSVEVRHRLGRIYLDHLEDPHQALECFRQALSDRTGHEPSVKALEELMELEDHRGPAAEILEPVYLSKMDWPKVTRALEARLAAETNLDSRKSYLRRLGEIHEDYREDLEGAMEAYARLFREDPADTEVWDTLSRLARVLEKWERLAEIYGEALEEITVDDPSTARLARLTGELYAERVGDRQKADQYFARALRFDPTDRDAFQALEAVRQRNESWDSLLDVYREQVDVAADDRERVALLHKTALLKEERLADPSGAVDVYREVLEVDPEDGPAMTALDRLLTQLQRWSELSDHLRYRIERAGPAREQIELKHRLGQLLADELDDKLAAVDVFEEVVLTEPSYTPTVSALEQLVLDETLRLRITKILEPIYRGHDEWKKLVAILEAQVELSDVPEERVPLLGEIAQLHEVRGRDLGRAFGAWARAFADAPHDEQARSELDRLAVLLEAWDDHVAAYERGIGNCNDPVVVSQLLSTMARVHDERRGDPRSAIETYERLLAHDPDDASPLDALQALHTMVGDWRGLCDVFRRKTERSMDAAERAELLRQAGSVLEELLGDVKEAIEAYRQAADEDPNDDIALEALDRLYQAKGRSAELAEVLRKRIDLAGDPDGRVELGVRLATLSENELNQPSEAIAALARVLEDQPMHGDAVVGLGRLYEREGMWSDLLDNLRLQAGMAEDPASRVALTYRAGEVLERELSDVGEAITTYQQALELDPSHETSREALFRISEMEEHRTQAASILEPLLTSQERWDELATLLERKVESATDPLEKRDELRRVAGVHETGRGDVDAAFDALSRALAEDPADTETAVELERLAGQLNAWERLANVFAARASSVLDPAVGRALYVRLARIAEENLQDDTRAIEAYSRAVEQVGDDAELLEALDVLYTKTQGWPELAEVLDRQVALADEPGHKNELLVRLGQLREEQFQDPRAAFAAYQDVLEGDPGHADALAALERLAREPELALEIVDVLDNAYRQTGATDKVAALYDVRIELADTDGERVRLLQEAAAIWEQDLRDPSKALSNIKRAFELDPRDTDLLSDMERLAGATGNWETLRGVVERVGKSPDMERDLRRDLNVRAASWYRDRLSDAASAEACLRAAIETDHDAVDAHGELVDLLRTAGREADLVKALRAWAAVEMDSDARKQRVREAAALAESALGNVDLAAECHESILEDDRSDPRALADLARLREAQGRWADVVKLIAERVEVEADPAERRELRRRAAEIHRDRLGDKKKAMEAFQGVLDEEPGDLAAMDALERLYEDDERWDDLRQLVERRLDLAESDAQRIAARVRLARLSEQAFGRRAEAIEQLREILELDAHNREALDELERLLALDGQWEELVGLLDGRVRDALGRGEREEAIGVLGRLATVQEEKLGAAEKAIDVHERALELDPGQAASLHALVRLHEAASAWQPMAGALERLLAVQSGPEAIETALRLADAAEERLSDPDRAEAALRRAYDLSPGAANTRDRLKAHHEKHQRWAKLAEMLDLEERDTHDAKAKVALLKRAAELYTTKLNDPGTAAGYLERASKLVPDDRDVLLPLCDLYIAAGRQQDAVPVLQQIIASFGTRRVKELAQFHHRLGKALEGMGDSQGALGHYDAAFKIDLTNVAILRDLGKLCHRQGDLDRAQKTFRALLLQKLDGGVGITKADVYFYLGDIAAKQGDKTKAVSMLERAVAEQSDHPTARQLLTQLKG